MYEYDPRDDEHDEDLLTDAEYRARWDRSDVFVSATRLTHAPAQQLSLVRIGIHPFATAEWIRDGLGLILRAEHRQASPDRVEAVRGRTR
ncbi:MAG TPA: hypothetical protein VMC04_21900 [Verrucomicrobiae bacterium]|jgi:hypothetical protein|nr:hypothetical protein [Verrucomicrobiae bacterium]